MDLTIREIVNNIQGIYTHTMRIAVQLYEYPYHGLEKHDMGFRKMIWTDFDYYNEAKQGAFSNMSSNIIAVNRSSLGFINIFYKFPKELSDDLIIIGPFLQEMPTQNFIEQLIQNNHLEKRLYKVISDYYKNLPVVDELNVIIVLQNLLPLILPMPINPEVMYLDYKNVIHPKKNIKYDNMKNLSVQLYDKQINTHKQLIYALKNGDTISSKKYLEKYIRTLEITSNTSLALLKAKLIKLNGLFEQALIDTTISPVFLRQLNIEYDYKIENEYRRDYLEKMPYKLVIEYCNLVKKHSYKELTFDIRKAIQYIHEHLEEKISLNHLAEYIEMNPSVLSNKFKKSLGMTITDFIRKEKMERAKHLLSVSRESISDISFQLGYDSISYFSKHFKNYEGMTPSQYRSLKTNS